MAGKFYTQSRVYFGEVAQNLINPIAIRISKTVW